MGSGSYLTVSLMAGMTCSCHSLDRICLRTATIILKISWKESVLFWGH